MHKEILFNREVLAYKNRPKSITELFDQTVTLYPNQEAIVDGSQRMTYQELSKSVDMIALYLQIRCHFKKRDRLALLMENRMEFTQMFLACAKLGIILVPLNARCPNEELLFMIEHTDIQAIFAESGYESLLQKWQKNKDENIVILTDETIYDGEHIFFSDIFDEKNEETIDPVVIEEEDDLYIVFTSGTTGKPKGAIGSHTNVIHSALNYKQVMQIKECARTIIAVPLFHVTGLIGQFIHMILIGGTSVIMKQYKTSAYLQLIEQEKITFLFNVPTIYIMLMNNEKFPNTNIGSVEVAAYGGAPMSVETIERLTEKMPGLILHNAYGASETSSPASIMPKQAINWSKVESVGKPVPVGDIKIVDDAGKTLKAGEVGELYIKGPMIVKGYWRNEEANKENFVDGYWKSGDIAILDEDNYLYIKDRKKDMINRGGEKVFSSEVENTLYEYPEVVEVAVLGIPDDVFGEEVKAFVVAKNNDINLDRLNEFLKSKLAKYKVPKEIEIIEKMPRNAGGKIVKGVLMKQHANK